MEEQAAQNLARKWIYPSGLVAEGIPSDNALWTGAKVIEDLVPDLDYTTMIPTEEAASAEGTKALDELLVLSGRYLYRVNGTVDSESSLAVRISRVTVADLSTPTITERRIDVNRADVRQREWDFVHTDGSHLILKTERIVNAEYDRTDPEEFAQELAALTGWNVSSDSGRAPIMII